MALVVTGSGADVALVVDAANVQDGLPAPGEHLAQTPGERHCDMPPTWDGTGNVPPGWSDWRAGIRAAPPDDPDGDTDAPEECGPLCDARILEMPPGPQRGALAAARARTKTKDRSGIG